MRRHSSTKATANSGTDNTRGLNPVASAGLVTIGGSGAAIRSKDRKALKSVYDIDEAEEGDWTRLDEDNNSDKESTVPIRGIRKDTTFEMSALPVKGGSQ
jgi:hypothetical protein